MKFSANKLGCMIISGLLIFFIMACNSNEKIKMEPESLAPPAQPQKYALLVAVDQYAHTSQMAGFMNLSGCVNDALDLKNVLLTKYQFPEDHIVTLFNNTATRENIIDAFRSHLIDRAQAKDVVLFYFSGHGSQMPDQDGDEPDKLDETLVPHDSRDKNGKVFDVNDDEINGLLKRLAAKTHNITFIFDACHSGTGTKGFGIDRQIPADTRIPPKMPAEFAVHEKGVADGKSGMRPDGDNFGYVLVAACLQSQSAKEVPISGKWRGALTYYLVQELKKTAGQATYRDVMDQVASRVGREVGNQTPQLEGPNLDQYTFKDSLSVVAPHILLSNIGSTLLLKAGLVEGLTEGSIYAIYPPGSKDFNPAITPVARVEITSLTDIEAKVKIVEGSTPADNSRAVEVEHNYPNANFAVFLDGNSTSNLLRQVGEALRPINYIRFVAQRSEAKIAIFQKQNQIILEGPDPELIRYSVPVNSSDVVFQVVNKVRGWARWHNLLDLENKTRPFEMKLAVQPAGGNCFAQASGDVQVFKDGRQVDFCVENKSNQTLYFLLLDFSTDGSISAIQSVNGAAEQIAAKSSWKVTWPVGVPEDRKEVMDHIKLIASINKIDHTAIEQAAVKAPSEYSALDQLLANHANGMTKNVRTNSTGQWVTTVTSFKVVRD